jgi:3-hydroxyisobutyrate dehydrogenase
MTTQTAAQQITLAHPDDSRRTPPVAFLGTGRMGGPMAANLARAGFAVRAWDRTASQTAVLIEDGATVAASPADAVKGAGILITMLADGPATEQAWSGPDGLLLAASPRFVHDLEFLTE